MSAIFFLVTVFILITLGLLTLSNNPKNKVNRLFFVTCLLLSTWVASNYFADADVGASLFWTRLAFFSVISIIFAFTIFFDNYPFKTVRKKISVAILLGSTATMSILVWTPLIVSGVFYVDGVSNVENGPLYFLFVLYFLYYVGRIVQTLIKQYTKLRGVDREKIRFILGGIALMVLVGSTTNLFLPLILGTNEFAPYGLFATVIFAFMVFLAIIKHGLFDIRLLAARATAYLLSLGFIGLTYGTIFIFVSKHIPDKYEALFYVSLAFVTALIFQSVKAVFDKSTSRIFFRDGYDPQEFLDQLNGSIVSNIEIGILLRRTTTIIEENLKSSYVQIVVPKTESTEERIVGTNGEQYSEHEANYMRGRLVGLGKKVVTIDDLDDVEEELRSIMSKHNISVLVHLSATSYGQYQTIAFMVLGDKKSGNVYTKSDLRIIDIIADELVIAIQNALRYEEIQEFNVTLQSKVNTATNKLKRTNEKLKTIDATKDEFISMASHQLRTPLTSVKGYLSMVLEGDAGDITPEQKKLLDQAFVSSQRMVYLIADLLNVSRLKTGKFIIDSQSTDLAEVVEGEVSQLIEQAKAKNIRLTYEKPKDFPRLKIDETKTRQVVMNFVDNALYYTPNGGKIDVELKVDKSHAYFTVKDNGLGVPEQEKKHLFEKFYRAKNARKIRPDGTGLGLFMAKKVILAQGGNMLFESKEGKGSTFGFTFPLKHLRVDDEEQEK